MLSEEQRSSMMAVYSLIGSSGFAYTTITGSSDNNYGGYANTGPASISYGLGYNMDKLGQAESYQSYNMYAWEETNTFVPVLGREMSFIDTMIYAMSSEGVEMSESEVLGFLFQNMMIEPITKEEYKNWAEKAGR